MQPSDSEQQNLSPKHTGAFGWLYRTKDWIEGLAEKAYALPALFVLSLSESIFFPIPPDVLLIALCVGKPKKSLKYGAITTVASLIGAVGGYAIGFWLWYNADASFSGTAQFFFDIIPGFTPEKFALVGDIYKEYGFWFILVAGFTPIPYKIFTVTAGVFKLSFPIFMIASLFGRAGRFFLVSGLFYFFGTPIKKFIDQYLEWLVIGFTLLLIGGFVLIKFAL